jgi:thiol:disulfide interchange protein/DsbC/DsbD-like thiol-disulfide interchange protein
MSFRYLPGALLLSCAFSFLARAEPVQTDYVEAELVAENQTFKPGDFDNWVALRLRPEPGWHVYWRNQGDSGIPTRIDWRLPPQLSAGPIQWPYPHRESLGELTNYGYAEETLHLVPVRVDAGVERARLQGKASWLVCKDICIPGEAELALDVAVADGTPQPDPAWRGAFDKARAALPRATPDWQARFAIVEGTFSLAVEGAQFEQQAQVEFFPYANDLLMHAAEPRVQIDPVNGLRLSQPLSAYFVAVPEAVDGVLVVKDARNGTRAFEIQARAGEVVAVPAPAGGTRVPSAHAAPSAPSAPTSAAQGGAAQPFALMLLFALLGGLVLNLMPCVFPVLAIKALSVLEASGQARSDHRRQALAYTAGVVASFVAVAALLIALRAGGAALGWGFQLQSPGFVYALTAVIFAMGLSLAGLAQFGLSWMGAGQSLAARPGLAGSFFTGVLAVVVASPCTAPFMAPALGFALAQPAAGALLVFAVLGLGLALPFLLIGFVPRLAALLPRPGAWMETFKQAMAFPMFITAVWLLWVLGGLTDRDGMALALLGLVLVALAVWLWGRARSGVGQGLALGVLILAALLGLHPSMRPAAAGAAPVSAAPGWEPYSDQRLAELRAQGRSVFVDFTADWCLTCKLNERGALQAQAVRDTFRRQDVALLVGDWTRADPAITAVLDRYGRSGVPLYLASKDGAEPRVLPQVLTPDIITSAFE